MTDQERAHENRSNTGYFFGVTSEIWTIFAIRTINSFGYSATLPFLGVYLLKVRGVPLGEIGMVYLATGVLGFSSQILSGRLSDSLGPKKVMLLGYTSSVLFSLLIGFLISVDASVFSFFFIYPVFSLCRGISQPATASIIASQKTTSEIRTGFSFLNIAGNLGFAAGPALSGIIIDLSGYSTAFILSAAAAGAAGVIAEIWIRSDKGEKTVEMNSENSVHVNRWLSWKRERNIILFLLLTFSLFVCIGYEITPLSLYVSSVFGLSNTLIGYLFATNGLVIVLLQLPITRLVEKYSNSFLLLPLIFSAGLAATSFLIAGLSKGSFLEWELFMFVITLAEITLTVPSQSIIAFFSVTGNRGTYQGYYSATSNAGKSLASFVGPTSLAIFSFYPQLSWFAVGVLAAVAGIALAALSPSIQKDYESRKWKETESI
jgi:predicted MFS family arabinose efflux permease